MFDAPIVTPQQKVLSEWIDYNGHMNMAFYNAVFDRALDSVFDRLGVGWEYVRDEKASCFTLEAHVVYLQEVAEGDPLEVTFQLLDFDSKRIHYFEEMYHADVGYLAATSEQICMHVSMETRRSAPFPESVMTKLGEIMDAHRELPRPAQAGRVIGIPRKAATTSAAD